MGKGWNICSDCYIIVKELICMNEIVTNSREETIALGKVLGKNALPGMFFALKGDLAGGKTTFTKGIGLGLGITDTINSPTFTILKIYHGDKLDLYHIDAYRLENNDYDLGLDEEADSVLSVVEWPEYYSALPNEYLEIEFAYIDDEKRLITLRPFGRQYEELLENCGLC